MKVLVTGGSGVVGTAAVDQLLAAGHQVRLLSRHARRDARRWPEGVEPWPADITDGAALHGCAEGCEGVLHSAGIARESPPERTFHSVNVDGTRLLLSEARRAGVRRFIYVSSLGAERGSSDYHRSKHAAERLVREQAPAGWLILRPGNVYGPGDEVISLLLKMVRALPVVPVVGSGDHPFQPVWHEDLGKALARAFEREEPRETALPLSGCEVTTTREVLQLLEKLTGKNALRLPIPEALVRLGVAAADRLGADLHLSTDQITMLVEENVIGEGEVNALTEVFGITPLTLAEGLGRLVDEQPERLPSEGTGALELQRYWADIRSSTLGADGLFELVRREFRQLPPPGLLEVGSEPGSDTELEVGNTLTMGLPLRGNIQVRVADISGRAITCLTLRGHPLSGAIRFAVEERPDQTLRFEVRSWTRPSDLVDLIGMRTFGQVAQKNTWRGVVDEVVQRSGGAAPDGVQEESRRLEGAEAEAVEEWVEELAMRRQREQAPGPGESKTGRAA